MRKHEQKPHEHQCSEHFFLPNTFLPNGERFSLVLNVKTIIITHNVDQRDHMRLDILSKRQEIV